MPYVPFATIDFSQCCTDDPLQWAIVVGSLALTLVVICALVRPK